MTKVEEWAYNLTSVKESFAEKEKICTQDDFCKPTYRKGADPHGSTTLCKHFDQLYKHKWKVFLG